MSLTRQVLFLLPLIVVFSLIMGIDGVMYAGPIADAAALSLADIVCAKRACGHEEIIKKTDIMILYFRRLLESGMLYQSFFINTAD